MVDRRRPLRLAFIANPTHILVHRWVNFFAARGHDVTVLDGFAFPDRPGLDPRVQLIRYDARGTVRLPLAPTIHARRVLRGLLREIQPDVVHAHSLHRYGWQAGVAGWHPYVISTWGSDVLLPPATWQARFWNRRTMARASLVTAVSDYMRRAAMRAGARPDRIALVHFGVDTRRFAPGRSDPDVLGGLGVDGRPIVFSPRALKPIYNHETILSAFARLGEGHQMVMTGRNAEPHYRARIEGAIRELGIEARVRLVDDIPDEAMLALFRSAAVVVSAPVSDSFPITLLEAMACGTPVVAGDLPPVRAGLHDVAPDALVPTHDVEAMAAAIGRAVRLSPAERQRIGQALRLRAVESDYETNMLRMEELYYALLAGGDPA